MLEEVIEKTGALVDPRAASKHTKLLTLSLILECSSASIPTVGAELPFASLMHRSPLLYFLIQISKIQKNPKRRTTRVVFLNSPWDNLDHSGSLLVYFSKFRIVKYQYHIIFIWAALYKAQPFCRLTGSSKMR